MRPCRGRRCVSAQASLTKKPTRRSGRGQGRRREGVRRKSRPGAPRSSACALLRKLGGRCAFPGAHFTSSSPPRRVARSPGRKREQEGTGGDRRVVHGRKK